MEIWSLKTQAELGMPKVKVGTFTAIGGHGQTNWLQLNNTEMAFIKSIGDNLKLWTRVYQKAGTIYLSIPKDPNHMNWPVILCASADPAKYIRNQIGVMEYSKNKSQFRAAGIPELPSYHDFSPELQPWLFHGAYTIYPNGGTGLTFNGMLFQMPIFDPASGFKTSKGCKGLWYPVKFLHERIS